MSLPPSGAIPFLSLFTGMTKIAESRGDPSVLETVEKLGELRFRSYALASEEANLLHLRKLKPRELGRVGETPLGV